MFLCLLDSSSAGTAYHYWFNYLNELPALLWKLKQSRQRGKSYVLYVCMYISSMIVLYILAYISMIPSQFLCMLPLRRAFRENPSCVCVPQVSRHRSEAGLAETAQVAAPGEVGVQRGQDPGGPTYILQLIHARVLHRGRHADRRG